MIECPHVSLQFEFFKQQSCIMSHPQLYHNNTRAPILAPISKAKKHLKQYDEALPMLLKALEANGD